MYLWGLKKETILIGNMSVKQFFKVRLLSFKVWSFLTTLKGYNSLNKLWVLELYFEGFLIVFFSRLQNLAFTLLSEYIFMYPYIFSSWPFCVFSSVWIKPSTDLNMEAESFPSPNYISFELLFCLKKVLTYFWQKFSSNDHHNSIKIVRRREINSSYSVRESCCVSIEPENCLARQSSLPNQSRREHWHFLQPVCDLT